MTYVDDIKARLAERIPGQPPALLDLYALLALSQGVNTSLAHVHDAWALWRSRTHSSHPSILPFDELTADVQALDEPYAAAIRDAAASMLASQP
ncbi:hypothetical protein OHV08_33910 [Streptomyces canus]|uniref:DUF7701 domain-containing protein n=1 Tax=Streptomyces canus TaxID=58343 RepID=UPI00324D8177